MNSIQNVKVITKDVVIRGDHYYLVRFNIVGFIDEHERDFLDYTMYGTLPYEFIGPDGKFNRRVSIADMCGKKTIPEALEDRELYYKCKDMIAELNLKAGDRV